MQQIPEEEKLRSPKEAGVNRVTTCKTSLATILGHHPWPHPKVMALDVELLRPLQGVHTISMTNKFQQYKDAFLCRSGNGTLVLFQRPSFQRY
jgi:hypothetical protein